MRDAFFGHPQQNAKCLSPGVEYVAGLSTRGQMRLDHDLARSLLQKIGELPFDGRFHDVSVEGHSGEEISNHVMLLKEVGLIEAIEEGSHDGVCWRPKHLTYVGNEFLWAAESDTVWNKAKGILWKSTKTITLEGLKMALPLAVKALTGTQSTGSV